MTTLTTLRPAAAAAAVDAGGDAAASVWRASSCWSWRTPSARPAVALGQSAHSVNAHMQILAVDPRRQCECQPCRPICCTTTIALVV